MGRGTIFNGQYSTFLPMNEEQLRCEKRLYNESCRRNEEIFRDMGVSMDTVNEMFRENFIKERRDRGISKTQIEKEIVNQRRYFEERHNRMIK